MEKKTYLQWLAMTMVALLCIGFASCSKDNDETPVKTGKIIGLVSDYANSNTPVAGATVTLVQQGEVKVTGSDGRFEFDNLRPGSYTVAVTANNFQANTQMAYVTADEATHCDFQLQRSSQNVELSPMSLTFGKNIDQLSFYIINNTNQLLTYSFSNVPSYLQISPSSGSVAAKGRQAIVATIPNRSTVTTTGTQIVLVNIGNDSYALTITMTNSNVTPPTPTPDPNPDPTPTPTTGDVTRGLLAYYNFDDGTANNAAGTQNNGVINGAASFITDTPKGTGKALFLDQEQYVNVARNPLNSKDTYTVSLWAKDFGVGYLFTTLGSDNLWTHPAAIYINSDGKISQLNPWDSKPFNFNVNNLQSSGWHMITIVHQEMLVELYIDGNLTDSVNDEKTIGGNKMQIGGRGENEQFAWTDPFKVDNVRVYGVALTEEEVAQLYNYEK